MSPLRGKNCYLKDLVGNGTIADHYNNKLLSTQRGITVRDRNDVMTCDAILANLSDSKKVSIGTVMEIAWADMLRKPIVVVMDESNVHWHAMIREVSGFVTPYMKEAVELLKEILRPGVK